MSVSTERIRIELLFGPLSMAELKERTGERNAQRLGPLVWQMRYRTMEIDALPGKPTRYVLMRQIGMQRLVESYRAPAADRTCKSPPLRSAA